MKYHKPNLVDVDHLILFQSSIKFTIIGQIFRLIKFFSVNNKDIFRGINFANLNLSNIPRKQI